MLTGSSSELPSSSGTTSPLVTPRSASCFASPLASRSSRPYVSVAPACTTAGRRGCRSTCASTSSVSERNRPAGTTGPARSVSTRRRDAGPRPAASAGLRVGSASSSASTSATISATAGADRRHGSPGAHSTRTWISSPTTQPTLTAAALEPDLLPTVSDRPSARAAPIAAVVSPGSRPAASTTGSIRTSGGIPASSTDRSPTITRIGSSRPSLARASATASTAVRTRPVRSIAGGVVRWYSPIGPGRSHESCHCTVTGRLSLGTHGPPSVPVPQAMHA